MEIIKLPPLLFCENKIGLPGAGIILYTKPPYYIGRVAKYISFESMTNTIARSELIAHCIVPGYNITIQFAGTLTGRISAQPEMLQELQEIINQMAQFYLDERVHNKIGYYSRKYSQIKNP